jgi:hypothetical protein
MLLGPDDVKLGNKVYSAILIPRERLPLINMLTVPLIAPYCGRSAFGYNLHLIHLSMFT